MAQTTDDKIQHYLMFFFRLSVIVAMPFSLYFREWGAFAYCLLALSLMFLPVLIRSRAKVSLPIEFDLVLVIFMYSAVFLGKVGRAYEHFWWWDAALHTSSGFIMAYVAFLVLFVKFKQNQIQANRRLFGFMIFCIALAFGALWEIFEFGVDQLLNGNLQRGSLRDTMWDLMVDAVGALIMARVGIGQVFDNRRGFISRWTKRFISDNPHLKGQKHA